MGQQSDLMPQVGDRVRILVDEPRDSELMAGDIVPVVSVDRDTIEVKDPRAIGQTWWLSPDIRGEWTRVDPVPESGLSAWDEPREPLIRRPEPSFPVPDGMRPCCASKPGLQHRSYCTHPDVRERESELPVFAVDSKSYAELMEGKPTGKDWEVRAWEQRGAVVRAASAWRKYRRDDGTPGESYASLCADLDRAVDEYQETIRAY